MLTGAPVLEDLMMDVYEPIGDTMTQRPLFILVHGGSLLPQDRSELPFGDRHDNFIVELGTQMAKRGWVVAAIDYRLGWDPQITDQEIRMDTYMNALYKAMQDVKTCVRFFRKDVAENGNIYGINPNNIAVGGNEAGGSIALAVASFNSTADLGLPKFLNSANHSVILPPLWGDFDGLGGIPGFNQSNHAGYASDVQLVLNLGGVIGDTTWIQAGDAPIVSMHGMANIWQPYFTTNMLVDGNIVVEVSGSLNVSTCASMLGNQSVFANMEHNTYTQAAQARTTLPGLFPITGYTFDNSYEPWAWYNSDNPYVDQQTYNATGVGSSANPWASRERALAYIDTVIGFFTPHAAIVMGLNTGTDVCSRDAFENNDTPEYAKPFPVIGIHKNARICDVGDEDWFYFTIGAKRNFSIKLYDLPTDLAIAVYHSSNLEIPLVSSDNVGDLNEVVTVNNANTGEQYFIKIYTQNGSFVDGAYSVALLTRNIPFSNPSLLRDIDTREDEIEEENDDFESGEPLLVHNNNEVKVYPNPARDASSVQFFAKQEGIAQISIMDLQGRVLFRYTESAVAGVQTIALQHITELSSGMYWVNIQTDNERYIAQLQIVR